MTDIDPESELLVSKAAPQRVRTKTFLFLVAVYISPLVYYLAVEEPPKGRYLTTTPSVLSVLGWIVVSLTLYIGQRAVAFTMKWKINEKTSAIHKEDIFRMTLLNVTMCIFGRVGARLESPRAPTFLFLAMVYTFFFGVLFEMVATFNIEFTKDCFANPAALIFAGFLIFILSALAWHHFSLAATNARFRRRLRHYHVDDDDGLMSLPGAIALFILVIAFHVILSLAPGNSSAHWHHWYTGFLGALFCVFDSMVSQIAQVMLLGIFLHGAAFFGVEPCFSPDPSSSDQDKI